jgi:hypothetical protein
MIIVMPVLELGLRPAHSRRRLGTHTHPHISHIIALIITESQLPTAPASMKLPDSVIS